MGEPGKRVLHIGLGGPINNEQVTAGMTEELIRNKVMEGIDNAHKAGHHVQPTFFQPENFLEKLGEVKKELETGKWDALLVGGGMRFTPSLTPQFEQLINTARVASPGTRMLFQAAPNDVADTIKRGFEGDS